MPCFDKEFILETDACDYGIGAVLSQEQDGQARPIEYFSKHLNKAQRNYSASEKELYAIFAAIEHFKQYLFGREFTVVSDNQPLKWLLTAAQPASRLARWLIHLQNYLFKIVYREGHKNGNADGLSRLPIRAAAADQVDPSSQEEFIIGAVVRPSPRICVDLAETNEWSDQRSDADLVWIIDLIAAHW